ncbi:MAG: hypothetical protein CR993_01500 [Rhodobacterales bacterium]|nr:MAG: hypothetical protein CR993_01500 [Rhodobacterales bacterium]
MLRWGTAAALVALTVPQVALADGASEEEATALFIAGVKPYERPEGAPVVSKFGKNNAWYVYALTGVKAPYPSSLRFLEDQEAWFDPFLAPGMTGPYDIRGWH